MADWRDDEPSRRWTGPRRSRTTQQPSSSSTSTPSNTSVTTSSTTTNVVKPGGATNEHDKTAVVEKTRQEREERAKRKKQETEAVKIQRIIRGWLVRIRVRKEFEEDVKRKLQDIDKIQAVLRVAKKGEFVLPVNSSVGLARCAWMVHRLRPRLIRTKRKIYNTTAVEATETILCSVARVLCTVVRTGAYETIWDDGTRLRTRSLVENELSATVKGHEKLQFCRTLIESDFFFGWIDVQLRGTLATLLRTRLMRLSASSPSAGTYSTVPSDADAVELVVLSHTRLVQKRSNDCAYGLLLFSIPGLFTKVSSLNMYQALTQPSESWTKILRELCGLPSVFAEKERDELILSRTGNLFSFFIKVPQLSLETNFAYETTWRLFQLVPRNTFTGSEGVAWTGGSQGVSRVDPLVMAQLDLAHVITVMSDRCFKVNSRQDTLRRIADKKEWDALKFDPEGESGSGKAESRKKSRILSIMSSSSWAKKLGWSKQTDAPRAVEEEEESLLSPAAVAKGSLAQEPLFLRESALSDFLKMTAVYLSRWPPKSTNPKTLSVLNALAFSFAGNVVDLCWTFAESRFPKKTPRPDLLDEFWSSSFVFACIAVHFLLVTDESELYDNGVPMSRAAIERCVTKLNEALFGLWDLKPPSADDLEFERSYVFRVVRFLTQLRDMHSRRELTREQAWLLDKSASTTGSSSSSSFFASLLPVALGGRNESGRLSNQEQRYFEMHLYWCVPFHRRAKWFTETVATERTIHQPPDQPPTYKLSVRRRNGGLDEALPFFLKSDLKKRVYVVFVNEFGLPEAGIDSRGLFKEFTQTLAELIFDPNRGLFAVSQEGDKGLFPNPRARMMLASSSNHETLQMFNFAGRLLGKALFEGIVIQPEFSFFILAKLLGKLVTIADLASLDQDLFRNLLFLKNTKQDVRDLCLSFSITSAATGREVELFPGGSQMEVTSTNKYRYVNMVAHHRLNVENKEEHDAFVSGFRSVIAPEWIAPFSERELQVLISGSGAKINVADLKANCAYGGGYFPSSQVVVWFWEIMEREMDDKERQLLLRFATACTRAPLLGFAHLEPRFQIQRISLENMQLPTASTCFNTLKIPPYPTKAVLREKLLKAIHSGAGFELT